MDAEHELLAWHLEEIEREILGRWHELPISDDAQVRYVLGQLAAIPAWFAVAVRVREGVAELRDIEFLTEQ